MKRLEHAGKEMKRVAPNLPNKFSFSRQKDTVEATCPWGNRVRCHAPSPEFGRTELGLVYVDFDVPPRLTGPQKSIPWTRVSAAARDARDVFVSPSGALVAIQRPLLLTVHPVVKGRIQAAVLGHPLPQGVAIVSVQWLDAAATQRVRAALRGEGRR